MFRSAYSFIKQQRDKLEITKVFPGVYVHFGIRKQISRRLSNMLDCRKIVIDLSIDGLLLFKSSKTQL